MGCGKTIFISTRTSYNIAERLYWRSGKIPYETHYQISRTCYLEKYFGLYPYTIDIERRDTIDNKNIHLVNKYGYALICNPANTDETSADH